MAIKSTPINEANDTEKARYRAIVADIQADLDTFPAHLQALAKDTFATLAQADFSQIVGLLPYWLTDLLSVPSDTSHKLGVAHLYGWWYYYAQDELLDGDAPPTIILTGHLALLKMIAGYRALGVTTAPCWAEFEKLALISAENYTLEMQSRFTDLAELTRDQLAPWTVDLIINRASPFYFNTLAQLHLAGIPTDDPLQQDLLAALRYFGAARQISDDASDWLEDLQNGHLNYVSAQLIHRFYEQGLVDNIADLDLAWLIGKVVADETFLADIEQTSQSLAQQALDILAPYAPCRLQALVKYQMTRNANSWAIARTRRAKLRKMFGLA